MNMPMLQTRMATIVNWSAVMLILRLVTAGFCCYRGLVSSVHAPKFGTLLTIRHQRLLSGNAHPVLLLVQHICYASDLMQQLHNKEIDRENNNVKNND
jgi:hypothetical protein